MKLNGYDLVSECMDQDTLQIEDQDGKKEIPIVKRPVSKLDMTVVKTAATIMGDNTAKAKKDPDPKSMKSDNKKGTAAGNAK